MIRNFFIIASLLVTQFGAAQIIDNREGKAFQQEMFFSQEFLWQNKVSSITGVCQMKRTQTLQFITSTKLVSLQRLTLSQVC
jgi:hypothetical protein